MENNTVALSQAEVDKILGIKSDSESQPVEKKHYKIENFLSEKQLEEIESVCKSAYKFFKLALRERFGEPKIRKLTVKSIVEQNVDEFFDSINENDFLYHAKFDEASAYLKLDTFLFGALSGMTVNTKQKINFFQTEVLREFVASYLIEGIARQISEDCDFDIISLYGQEKSPFCTGKTGVCVTINWNENLKSFGIEKIFLTKELIASFRAVSK